MSRAGVPVGNARSLWDLFGTTVTDLSGGAGSLVSTRLRDGTAVVAAVKPVSGGHVVLFEPRASIDANAPGLALPVISCAFALALGAIGAGWGCAHYRRRVRRARIDRRRSARRVEACLDQGRCGIWDWDLTRGRVHWSASMYRLLGFDRDGEFLPPAVAASLMSSAGCDLTGLIEAAARPGGRPISEVLQARTASGEELWLRVTGEVVEDGADGSRHMVGLAVDVTAERTLAARRLEEGARLRDAVEALSEAFVLWDAEDRLILCNSKYLRLHGLPDELGQPGTPAHVVFAASRPPLVEKEIATPRATDPGLRTIETQLSDGRWLHINERRTRGGGVVSVGTDVSELKLAEERLRERERRLEGSVWAAETRAQRFAALAEQNYEANLAKTEFLARMSHELRTPLNAIIGFSDLMRQEIFGPLGSPRYREYSRDIRDSGLRLLAMIDAILHMSKLDKGQVVLAAELTDLHTVLGDAAAAIRTDAERQGVSIEADIINPAMLQADPSALREIVVQLLRNAVTYSPPGGVVRVKARPAGTCLNLFIEDAGLGIPADVLPRLGQPFEQLEAEYCRKLAGPGLGLPIARALAQLHGGAVRLRSQEGVGTIALIHLPIVQPAANDPAAPAPLSELRPRLVAGE